MRLDLLAALSGILIALQARANGELSHQLGNGLQAALVSFGSGLIIIVLISLFSPSIKEGIRNLRRAVQEKKIARWKLFAGMLGGTWVAVQTHIVPLIGLTGGGKKLLSKRRVAAALITVLAVLLSVLDRLDASNLSKFAVFLGVITGALGGIQRAMNGEINEYSHQSFTTSLLNFITGTTFLVVLLIIMILTKNIELVPLPSGPWWIYTGGLIGVIYIAFSSTIVQHLGVLNFTLFSVGGQLVGSLAIDLLYPTDGVQISAYLISGIVMTYLGVIVGGVSSSRVRKPVKPQ
jgi:transporter family-2 protein